MCDDMYYVPKHCIASYVLRANWKKTKPDLVFCFKDSEKNVYFQGNSKYIIEGYKHIVNFETFLVDNIYRTGTFVKPNHASQFSLVTGFFERTRENVVHIFRAIGSR